MDITGPLKLSETMSPDPVKATDGLRKKATTSVITIHKLLAPDDFSIANGFG
jgi:hypothetical protein